MMKGLKVEASSQTWKLYKARFTYNVRPRFWIMLLVASQQAHGKILISPIMQIAQITAYKSGMFQGIWEGKNMRLLSINCFHVKKWRHIYRCELKAQQLSWHIELRPQERRKTSNHIYLTESTLKRLQHVHVNAGSWLKCCRKNLSVFWPTQRIMDGLDLVRLKASQKKQKWLQQRKLDSCEQISCLEKNDSCVPGCEQSIHIPIRQ